MKVYKIILIHERYELVTEDAQKSLLIISSSLIEAIEKLEKIKSNYLDYKFQSIELIGDVIE